jgi:hypothetical protein
MLILSHYGLPYDTFMYFLYQEKPNHPEGSNINNNDLCTRKRFLHGIIHSACSMIDTFLWHLSRFKIQMLFGTITSRATCHERVVESIVPLEITSTCTVTHHNIPFLSTFHSKQIIFYFPIHHNNIIALVHCSIHSLCKHSKGRLFLPAIPSECVDCHYRR